MIILECYRRDDTVFHLDVVDRVTEEPVDISECTIRMTWRVAINSPIVLEKNFTISYPLTGQANVTILSDDTDPFENVRQEFVFDVELTKPAPGNEQITLVSGRIILNPEVTV